MSAPGRPKRKLHRSAQHEGSPVTAPGRPNRELPHRSAKLGGTP